MLSFFKTKKKDTDLENKVKMFINAGIEYFKKRDYLSSRKYFERVLVLDPANAEAENYLKSVIIKIEQEEKKRIKQQQQQDEERSREHVIPVLERHTVQQPVVNTSSNNNSKNSQQVGDAKDRQYYYKVLRLDPNAVEEDIKESIAGEFKKWRTRVNSPDIVKRFEAEEMLNIISQAKRVLLGDNN